MKHPLTRLETGLSVIAVGAYAAAARQLVLDHDHHHGHGHTGLAWLLLACTLTLVIAQFIHRRITCSRMADHTADIRGRTVTLVTLEQRQLGHLERIQSEPLPLRWPWSN